MILELTADELKALKQIIATANIPWTVSNPLLMKIAQQEKANGDIIQQGHRIPHNGDTGNPRPDVGNKNRGAK